MFHTRVQMKMNACQSVCYPALPRAGGAKIICQIHSVHETTAIKCCVPRVVVDLNLFSDVVCHRYDLRSTE